MIIPIHETKSYTYLQSETTKGCVTKYRKYPNKRFLYPDTSSTTVYATNNLDGISYLDSIDAWDFPGKITTFASGKLIVRYTPKL